MKTKFLLSMSVFILLIITTVSVYADEPAIHQVIVDVELSEKGDAYISEIWDVTVIGGTEWYLAFNDMKDMKIANLSVTDETGIPYTLIESWDISQNISQKANKCGIIDKGSSNYEICWGVGSYGRHQFTVSYTITGLVRRYSDYAGFNHTFLSKDLSSPVDRAIVTIAYPDHQLDESAAKIWAFGYNGTIEFSGGAIIAGNNKQIMKNDGIIIMAEFENEYFPLAQSSSGTFEAVKAKALKGSDYAGENKGLNVGLIILIPVIIIVIGFGIVYAALKASLPDVFYRSKYGQSRSEMKMDAPETTKFPFEGNLLRTFGILAHLGEQPSHISVINYYMLKWLREGTITETSEQNKRKTSTYIILNRRSYGQDNLEAELYGMLAAASDNGRLSEKAIEQWVYKKYTEINEWYEEYKAEANDVLKKESLITAEYVKRAFVRGSVHVLSESGWQSAIQIYGLKNYLTSIYKGSSNDEISGELWDDYLMYADVFNIYDRMEGWYEDNNTGVLQYYYMSMLFRSSYKSGESRYRSDSDGGSSSFGGGGGATGGGGGGSR